MNFKIFFTLYIFLIFNAFSLYSQSNAASDFFQRPINLNIQEINDYSDFNYIDSSIKNSRIIFLGENSHTTKEYSLVKYKLIKYLHEKHGFDIVLFESGLADCFYSDKLKAEKDSVWILTHSIFSIWWTKTTLEMMNYLKSSQMTFGGFDFQLSSYSNSEFLKTVPNIDTSLISELYKIDTAFSNFANNTPPPLSADNYKRYKSFQVKLEFLYAKYGEELEIKKSAITPMDFKYYKRIILNKLFFIKNYPDSKKIYELRDSVMGNNLLWYCDTIYNNKKIIVWGANEHIAKHRSNLNSHYYAASILPERIKKQSYFIGLYAYSGEMYANPSNFIIKKPKRNSLENKIHILGNGNDVFLDFKHNYQEENFKWLNKKINTYHWGMLTDKIVPFDYYDGIILINKVSSR